MKKIINKTIKYLRGFDKRMLIACILVIQGFAIFSFVVGMNYLLASQGVTTVNVGADRNAQSGGSLLLTPTVSHSEGDPLSYHWTCTAGVLSSTSVLNPTLSLPEVAINTPITCTLTASADTGSSASDSLVITVIGGTSDGINRAPVIDIGGSRVIFSGRGTQLNVTVTDPDGDAMTYDWNCSAGTLSNPSILNPVYTAPVVSHDTSVICTIIATDSKGESTSKDLYITVTNTVQDNRDPIIRMDSDKNIVVGGSVKLSATVSDPDGDPLSYQWSCTQGKVSSMNILEPTFQAGNMQDGSVAVCTLEAQDNKGGGSSGTMNVYVGTQSSSNRNPIVNAPSVLYVQQGGSVKIEPTVSDPDGDILTYNWTCTGGRLSSYSILNPTFTLPTSTGTYSSYYCTITVSDGKGGSASSTVTMSVGQQGSSQNPVITTGGHREVIEGNTIAMNVSAYDPNGYSLTYAWTCTGGVLSGYSILNPNYTAPMVDQDTNYYCTITVNNGRGGTASANVSILVKDSGGSVIPSTASVVTNKASNVTTTTATLNGSVSGGNSVNTSFDWGRVNVAMTSTVSAGTKNNGESFSTGLTNLLKGKAYQFRAKGQASSGAVYGTTQSFITRPDAPSYFNATLYGSNQVSLKWTKGDGAYFTAVTRKVGSYPQTATDGTVVYYGTGSSYNDSVTSGQNYYYRAWSVAYDGGLYAWSDSDYARDYVTVQKVVNVVTPAPVQTVVRTVPRTVVVEKEEEVDLCSVSAEDIVSVKVTGKNVTQNKAWTRNITANPGDEIDVEIVVTSLVNQTVSNVLLTNILPIKVVEVSNVVVDGDTIGLNMYDGVVLGTFKPKESRVISFTIKLAEGNEFNDRETSLVNSVEVSGLGFDTVRDKLSIRVISGAGFGFASILSLFGDNWFWMLLLFTLLLFILLLLLVLIYLIFLLKKKDTQEREKYEREAYAAQRSKYFQIQ